MLHHFSAERAITDRQSRHYNDVDRNGLVDFADLNIVLSNLGTDCN
jgi:hypothetical protein